jgi:transcriptional regulator with XRE-family HTH domain
MFMTPFGSLLSEIRINHNLRQSDLAVQLGYEQTYLSALELGVKGPPPMAFVHRLAATLNLGPDEVRLLEGALEDSNRHLVIPVEATKLVYEAVNELRRCIGSLHPAQAEMILAILKLPQTLKIPLKPELRKVRRRSPSVSRMKETNMA